MHQQPSFVSSLPPVDSDPGLKNLFKEVSNRSTDVIREVTPLALPKPKLVLVKPKVPKPAAKCWSNAVFEKSYAKVPPSSATPKAPEGDGGNCLNLPPLIKALASWIPKKATTTPITSSSKRTTIFPTFVTPPIPRSCEPVDALQAVPEKISNTVPAPSVDNTSVEPRTVDQVTPVANIVEPVENSIQPVAIEPEAIAVEPDVMTMDLEAKIVEKEVNNVELEVSEAETVVVVTELPELELQLVDDSENGLLVSADGSLGELPQLYVSLATLVTMFYNRSPAGTSTSADRIADIQPRNLLNENGFVRGLKVNIN